MDDAALQAWVGRHDTMFDVASGSMVAGLASLLDHDASPWHAGTLPPLGHWLHFQPRARQSDIDVDGHPRRGGDGLLPPVELPRRMWAGGRVRFLAPIALETAIERRSTVSSIERKVGRTGEMVFVTVTHEISAGGKLAIREEQDIVYRGASSAGGSGGGAPARPELIPTAEHRRGYLADPVALFRYSALTFNAHRIHYDRDYAIGEEGYPGLVVHGPFIATLLMDHYLRRHPGAAISAFEFRAKSPLFDGVPFDLCSTDSETGASLWAQGPSGIAMTAQVTLG